MLRSKAKGLLDTVKICTRLEQENNAKKEKLEKTKSDYETVDNKVEELKREQTVLEDKVNRLKKSDVNQLVEEKQKLKNSLQENRRQMQDKEKSYDSKKDKQIEIDRKNQEEETYS